MKWLKKEIASESVRDLINRYSIDALTASILARRGFTKPEDVLFFLEDDPRYLPNPFLFHAMEDACDRVLNAIDEGEKVLVFGDRDVDGVTSTTLVYETLKSLGIDVSCKLPTGNESYGLSIDAVNECEKNYISLIITVDCGISNLKEVAYAKERGIDVIVIDHHIAPDELPDACAIINPKMKDSGYPFRDLSGCGVAYKFVRALRFARTELYKQQVCLLNVRPANESYVIEAVRLSNMAETGRLSETLVPGMVDISQTRLVKFLEGQQIFVYEAPVIKKMLARALGNSAEIHMLDISGEIAETIPQVKGLSLLRLKEKSKVARYSTSESGELDVFMNIFISFVFKKTNQFNDDDLENLQLVALGTIADLMPLVNENRILVKKGLLGINTKPRNGIRELILKRELLGKTLSAQDIAWQITPILNAAGRMGRPETALELLIEETREKRTALADTIIQMNEDRKKLGQEAWDIVKPLADASLEKYDNKLIIVSDKNIHRGVTGILAAKLTNFYRVPAAVISYPETGILVGSMRSARGVDVKAFLDGFKDIFFDYGGHDFAAGFSLAIDKLGEFEGRATMFAPNIEFGDGTEEECINIDADLPKEFLTPDIESLIERFEPFGSSNETLVFCARKVIINQLDLMGKPEPIHVKMLLDSGAFKWPAVYWKASSKVKTEFDLKDTVDVIFKYGKNTYGGVTSPQLMVMDVKKSL